MRGLRPRERSRPHRASSVCASSRTDKDLDSAEIDRPLFLSVLGAWIGYGVSAHAITLQRCRGRLAHTRFGARRVGGDVSTGAVRAAGHRSRWRLSRFAHARGREPRSEASRLGYRVLRLEAAVVEPRLEEPLRACAQR